MKSPSAAFLLLTLQWLAATVLALPPPQPIEERRVAPKPEKCTANQYPSFGPPGFHFCFSKKNTGITCARDIECRSGFCDTSPSAPRAQHQRSLDSLFSKSIGSRSPRRNGPRLGRCAQECSDQFQCPNGSACRNSACYRGDQAINSKCYANEDCKSENCIAEKCQPPNAKLLGEACEEKDNCEVGTMCWKGACSTRGFNFQDGTLGGSCYDAKHNLQCLDVAYCDPTAGYTCQPKKQVGAACGTKTVLDGLLAANQCATGRCVEGFCAPDPAGIAGEPCSQNEKACAENFECSATPYDGVNGPKKICKSPAYPDVGRACKQEADCPSQFTHCYRGGDSAITGTCQTTYTIGGKSCKAEDECGPIKRSKVWTDFGAYDGVDGGWGTMRYEDGFICSDGKCQDVHRSSADTKKISKG